MVTICFIEYIRFFIHRMIMFLIYQSLRMIKMNMIKNGMDYVKVDYLRLHWHHVANERDNKHENIKYRCLQGLLVQGALESAIYYILLHFKV